MNGETWLPAPGFPEYEVSSFGRIRRTISRTCSKAGAIIEGHVTRHGYRTHNASVQGRRKTLKFHRLVCEAFHGPAPSPLHHVAHGDGDRLNNRSENLRWATCKENHSDRFRHGTNPAGSKNGRANLCEAQVSEIRRLYSRGNVTTYWLADQYEVYPTTIQKIIKRETWKHVA